MKHTRLDEELIVTGGTDASASLDLLVAGGLDNITLWLTDTAGTGGTYTIEQSADGTTWEDYVDIITVAGDTDGVPQRAPIAGNPRYVRLAAGAANVTLAIGT